LLVPTMSCQTKGYFYCTSSLGRGIASAGSWSGILCADRTEYAKCFCFPVLYSTVRPYSGTARQPRYLSYSMRPWIPSTVPWLHICPLPRAISVELEAEELAAIVGSLPSLLGVCRHCFVGQGHGSLVWYRNPTARRWLASFPANGRTVTIVFKY
jgi:hypothetical protein